MNITQQVRDLAAAEGVSVDETVCAGLSAKAEEYVRTRS